MTAGDVQAREALPTRRSLREAAQRETARRGTAPTDPIAGATAGAIPSAKPAQVETLAGEQLVARTQTQAQGPASRSRAESATSPASDSTGVRPRLTRVVRPAAEDELTITPAHAVAERNAPTTGERAAIDLELLSIQHLSRMRAEAESSPVNRVGRRQLSREARARVREHSMPRAQRGSRTWIPRAAVVAALAAATIAVPATGSLGALQGEGLTKLVAEADGTTQLASAGAAGASLIGPSTYSIVQQAVAQPSTPPELAQMLSSEDRRAAMASRSELRSSLPGCDPSVIAPGDNGRLTESQLCELPQGGGYYLQPEAAVAFAEMSNAFEIRFGTPLRVTSAYRSYARQSGLFARNPGMTAAAGKSNHGWGYAVDFDKSSYTSSEKWQWLNDNAALFGFGNPDWAKGARYEPWHWEYMTGVVRVGNESGTGYPERLAAQAAASAAAN
ncbi:hypothetical protein GCM10010401_16320 [Rarobacter faecitabidus]|uniref:D-alanyl-D-alanine carboxypeptidase-like protein n=1 Tax=Rarobacter faecitabidus TaxID=13243 RepID=A0A542ZXN6_RARFA|nr:D-alanyl-D-alanine carboxypeptidase family protein [Rarobacter faecitabidus]TQL64966.1 D-alanyl-D-alanine carboxypeptidase-like protein [Rarobacter faecitabidus]